VDRNCAKTGSETKEHGQTGRGVIVVRRHGKTTTKNNHRVAISYTVLRAVITVTIDASAVARGTLEGTLATA